MTPTPQLRIAVSALTPGTRVKEPYYREARTVERVWREPNIDRLVCVRVGGETLYLREERRVKCG